MERKQIVFTTKKNALSSHAHTILLVHPISHMWQKVWSSSSCLWCLDTRQTSYQFHAEVPSRLVWLATDNAPQAECKLWHSWRSKIEIGITWLFCAELPYECVCSIQMEICFVPQCPFSNEAHRCGRNIKRWHCWGLMGSSFAYRWRKK